jgi:uncharacterized protein (DUF2252 family)
MKQSPFAFYRGAAAIVAAGPGTHADDRRPRAGVRRLPSSEFRRLCHDFDETLPAPWEWDVKRLAAFEE